MAKKKEFKDPLEDIDPVLEESFTEQPADQSAKVKSGSSKVSVADVEFPDLISHEDGATFNQDVFNDIPVKLSVELGRSSISLKDVYELSEGSIIELNRLVGEPLDLVVNGQIIANGEVVAVDNNYGLRIKTIFSSHA